MIKNSLFSACNGMSRLARVGGDLLAVSLIGAVLFFTLIAFT